MEGTSQPTEPTENDRIVRESLENLLINLDALESRIFAELQQQRRDIRRIIASL